MVNDTKYSYCHACSQLDLDISNTYSFEQRLGSKKCTSVAELNAEAIRKCSIKSSGSKSSSLMSSLSHSGNASLSVEIHVYNCYL